MENVTQTAHDAFIKSIPKHIDMNDDPFENTYYDVMSILHKAWDDYEKNPTPCDSYFYRMYHQHKCGHYVLSRVLKNALREAEKLVPRKIPRRG